MFPQEVIQPQVMGMGTPFKEGQTVQTESDEFSAFALGDSVMVYLDENTLFTLSSLSKDDLRIKFGHGRILVVVREGSSIEVDTPTAQNILKGTKATFVGYDFKKMTSIIPLSGSVRTTIPLLNQTFDTTTPITIHDVNPPTIETITFDQKTDPRAEFYEWAKQK